MADSSQSTKYSRQTLFTEIGEAGQEKLGRARVALVGCGALGSAHANALARAGVGFLRIIDRDFVEESNLQRQMLFDEGDAREALPKAVAAERKLKGINSTVEVEGVVADLTPENAEELLGDCDLILDGTDNFETRWLVNDVTVKLSKPWIYGGVVAGHGIMMPIVPGTTACFNCFLEGGAPQPAMETCDTVGVISPAVNWVSALQVNEALKMLTGKWTLESARLHQGNIWRGEFSSLPVPRSRADCRACKQREFAYLEGEAQPQVTMCGRCSVQIHERSRKLDLGELQKRLEAHGEVRANPFLLKLSIPPHELTVFADGRAVISGTTDPKVARSLYARYIGS
jgi:adenylyltransferase/sulfurtransferase